MAEPKKISALPDAATLTGTEEVAAVQSGDTVKATAQNIANLAPASGETNTASNVGAGVGKIFKQKDGVDLELKTIKAGTDISISNDVSEVTVNSTVAPGETNTASNVGTGAGKPFKEKSGVDLRFKSIKAGTNITVTNGADDITIDAAGGGGTITWVKSVKTDDYTVLASDSGTTLVMDAATTKTFTLPDTTGAPELTFRFIKQGAGSVTIDVENPSDIIGDGVAGEGLENTTAEVGATVTLQLIALNQWAIVSREGSWVEITPPPPSIDDGYVAAGFIAGSTKLIEKFSLVVGSFTTTSHGDAFRITKGNGGTSSAIQGFVHGGSQINVDKFDFTTANITSAHGILNNAARGGNDFDATASFSAITQGFGYAMGGAPTNTNVIDKYAYASNTEATDVGNLVVARSSATGHGDTVSGFVAAGSIGAGTSKNVEIFSLSVDADATSHGDLVTAVTQGAGASSSTQGFIMGGIDGAALDTVTRFTFAATIVVNDVGDLTVAKRLMAGISSTTHGFAPTGFTTINVTTVERVSFTVDANAVDIGDLGTAKRTFSGHQV